MKIEDEIKQKKFRSPHQKAVINLIYTSNWLQNKHHHFFKNFGITGQQFNILRILKGQHPQSISATEIKSRLLDQNSDVSRLLTRLEVKALITKSTCPNDKRASDVFITEKGLLLLEEIDKNQKEFDNTLALTPDEAKTLSDLLDKARGDKN
jgi:DNA-binding MarR family transcriptional regulator